MGFFSKILEKLGLKKDQPAAPAVTAAKPAAPAAKPAVVAAPAKPVAAAPVKPAVGTVAKTPAVDKGEVDDMRHGPEKVTAVVAPVSEVDVVKHLEKLSAGSGLDWKVSIVDLLKLLEIDSSREARTELAKELNCPADLMKDSAKMNVWLHKEVLKKIAENGGNIPASMLD
jgi:hypothetical protein